jgi:two-component system, OmpR family, response regulator
LTTRPARVLVVDDDAGILDFIRGVLEDEGHTVMTVADGGEAVAVAQQFVPDLMIVDVTLPVVSGHRVAAHLRELRGESFPVLVITADGQAVEKARQLRAYAYLRKPYELDALLDSVREGLDGATRAD